MSRRRFLWVASFWQPKRRRAVEEVKREKEDGGPLACCRCSRIGVDGGASSSSPAEIVGPAGECQEWINELESEFEAELERLQLYLDGESSSGRIEKPRIKTAMNTGSTRSCCMNSGEVIDPQKDGTERQHGVPWWKETRFQNMISQAFDRTLSCR